MDIAASYYSKGSLIGEFKGDSLYKVNKILKNMYCNKKLKKGFFFETKYKNSSDLRPNAIDYDRSFLDLLYESSINELLCKCIGTDYILSHIQIRKLDAGNTYLDWHRDSYNYGNMVGDFPPVHKIIYHPFFEGMSHSSKLTISRSSHLKMYNSKLSDLFNNVIKLSKNNKDKYFPSLNKFMLFNGSAFHRVDSDKKSSICLIYSFLRKEQIKNNPKRFTPLNQRTLKKYEKRFLI